MNLKAVLDTNVLISGIFWKGPPFEILKAWQQRRFTLVASASILEEYRRVATELVADHPVIAVVPILELIALRSLLVEPPALAHQMCTDPDDDKFLEAAIAADCKYVVTGDRALLRVKGMSSVEIIPPTQFLKILSPTR